MNDKSQFIEFIKGVKKVETEENSIESDGGYLIPCELHNFMNYIIYHKERVNKYVRNLIKQGRKSEALLIMSIEIE